MRNAPIVTQLMTVEEAAAWCRAEELQRAASFGTERRRREYLTWRAVVRQALGGDIEIAYNEVGAPVLVGREEYLSVSHGVDRVAVLIADHPCAVDLEGWERNFEAVKRRYLTPEEEALSTDPHFLAVAWCAKEALYKLSGEHALSLLDDLHLCAYEGEQLVGRIKGGEPVRLMVRCEADFLVVYTC